MDLVFDIGNSSVKAGLFDGATLTRTFRLQSLPTDTNAFALELAERLHGLDLHRVGISSVVPQSVPALCSAIESMGGPAPVLIHPGLPLPFELCYETPETLGADRLAAAVAGWVLFGAARRPPRAVAVIDAGTAVNYEVVRPPGMYLGGSIAPGPALLMDALARGTAQLPPVPLEMPAEIIGRSTRQALQAGIMAGFADSVRGMLQRIAMRLGEHPVVVCTGGWSPLLKVHLPEIDHLEPDLVLHGIHILVETASLSRD